MFITRATRHDTADIEELLGAEKDNWDPRQGTTFIARDGKLVGCLRLVEVAPETVVMDNVFVREDRRGEGVGGELVRAAMLSRGGTIYLCCHEDMLKFYEEYGFTQVAPNSLLQPVADYFDAAGDLHPPDGHEHFFMAAR
jgi:N-acetylglutamate synthase-like GNAT family acetyltransferase